MFIVWGGFIMTKNFIYSRQSGSIALNIFAVAFALMPFFTMSVWVFQIVKPDSRQVLELAAVTESKNPELFVEPIISVTFDDGWESIYSEGMPLMSKYNVPSTQYILPGEFNAPNYISAEQALSIKETGHEISSHTYDHANLVDSSDKEVDYQLSQSIKILTKLKLIDTDYRTFAAPNGALDERVLPRVKQDFTLARNTMGDLASDVSDNDMSVASNFSRYDVIGYTVGQYTTITQLEEGLDYAKEHNAWFIPIYHQIDESSDKYSVTPQEFERHLKLYKHSGITIATMRQVVVANQDIVR